ncbi:nucleotidyl transferase AbiEii/AbiGii toxin family protein [Chryseobacterium sp. YR221]|uniref:nucleotidyl transferase AbiEii/AbiGii toxin family protein n=1 Tax=Chryseobacterium sp. YR221 TaxID=1500293 RepID=UPI0009D83095|nr:nucleotidyl transferase AbiEii/AbiGii toxin family protein [Chryseobacterium sp. YR221]SMC61059.1 Nucleotidyl transferase AbiEii toxin, Type IV TA system [Chryseobacterium sp. YR221]
MLNKETVTKELWNLLQKLMKEETLQNFNLVGGTALSLQIGHRLSIDIDLFTTKDFDVHGMLDQLQNKHSATVRNIGNNTLMINIGNVKVDILSHKYDWQKPIKVIDNVRLASLEDIGAMKLHAIFHSGTRLKDFVDMYFLLEKNSLKDYLETYERKYNGNAALATYSLAFFDHIDKELGVKMLKGKEHRWSKISGRLKEASLNPLKKFLPPPSMGKGRGFRR